MSTETVPWDELPVEQSSERDEARDRGPHPSRCWCGGDVILGEPGPYICAEDIWHDVATRPTKPDVPPGWKNGLGWWVISGEHLMAMMRRAQEGEDIDLVYAEEYANCEHESVT